MGISAILYLHSWPTWRWILALISVALQQSNYWYYLDRTLITCYLYSAIRADNSVWHCQSEMYTWLIALWPLEVIQTIPWLIYDLIQILSLTHQIEDHLIHRGLKLDGAIGIGQGEICNFLKSERFSKSFLSTAGQTLDFITDP